jgi:hypothetical protein
LTSAEGLPGHKPNARRALTIASASRPFFLGRQTWLELAT